MKFHRTVSEQSDIKHQLSAKTILWIRASDLSAKGLSHWGHVSHLEPEQRATGPEEASWRRLVQKMKKELLYRSSRRLLKLREEAAADSTHRDLRRVFRRRSGPERGEPASGSPSARPSLGPLWPCWCSAPSARPCTSWWRSVCPVTYGEPVGSLFISLLTILAIWWFLLKG